MSDEPRWRRYLRFWRSEIDADIDEELRFHFASRIAELTARGVGVDEARRQAAAEFGDEATTRRGLHAIDARLERRRARFLWWDAVRADLSYALRGFRTQPLFALTMVLTLAIGIGAVTTMYEVMRRLLLQPPPHVAAPEQLSKLYFHYLPDDGPSRTSDRQSFGLLEYLRDASPVVAGIAAYMPRHELPVGRGTDAMIARATLVSGGFWRILAVRPTLGRFMRDEETHPETGTRVVVLGNGFWRRRFGGDPDVLGTTLQVKGQPYQIIGIAPRGFRGVELSDTDIWLPLFAYNDGERQPVIWRSSGNLAFVVRLPAETGRERVAAELTRHREIHDEAYYRSRFGDRSRAPVRLPVTLASVGGALGSDAERIPEATVAIWLVGIAVILLAIACANVAGLLLMRALRRRREIAVRLALGMSRWRLTALLLTESALLAVLGGIASAAVVIWGGAWVRRMLLPGMVGESSGLDWHVLLLAAACTAATAFVTGCAPALQTREDPVAGLREGAQHGSTRRSRLHRTLLIAQTALSVILLVGAGLFLLSLHRVATRDLGVDTENVLVVNVDFSGTGRSNQAIAAFFERALERVRGLPGVLGASLALDAPFRGARAGSFRLGGREEWFQTDEGPPSVNYVTPGYVATTGMHVIEGRTFQPTERTGPPVLLVNEALARSAWPGRSPVGECVFLGRTDTCARVVGVVGNVRSLRQGDADRLWFYRPLAPDVLDDRVLLVRSAHGDRAMVREVRRAVQELEPGLPYVEIEPVGAALDSQIRPWRLGATMFTAFGALAAFLAALGLYSAMAYAVTQRTREIGVRMAVGATGRSVLRLVVGDGLRIALLGVTAGILVALWGGRWLRDLLFETSPREPVVLLAVGGTLLALAVLASLAPARRAMRIDPRTALQAE